MATHTAGPAARTGAAADSPRLRARFGGAARLALVAAICVGAYHYSLLTLLDEVRRPAALAYVGLVPPISVLLGAALALRAGDEPDIHDRYVDWIVGLPLLGSALAILALGPGQLSTYFWLWRLDLLALPLFVAGAVVLAFGARAMWRLRLPISFLALASPAPYVLLGHGALHVFAGASQAALGPATAVLRLPRPVASGDGSLLLLPRPGGDLVLNAGSVGAGADGMLLLVALAVACLARGPLVRRAAWLLAAAALTWTLDLARLLALLAAGGAGPEQVVLQPLPGLAPFALGGLAMVAALPRFGLSLALPGPPRWSAGLRALARPDRLGGRQAGLALAVLLGAGALAGSASEGLRQFELVATPLGQPVFQPSTLPTHPVPGWVVTKTGSFAWITAYLGEDAGWDRYQYSAASDEPAPPPWSASPITLDLFTTHSRRALPAYGVETFYRLHGYRLEESRHVDLGGGVIGRLVVYRSRSSSLAWMAVYWDWPVRTASGLADERVVLNVTGAGGARATDHLVGFSRQVVLAGAGRRA